MTVSRKCRETSADLAKDEFDVVVIGAGFSGMYALYRLRGLGLELKGFEAGDGPGGTWYWNRYPGARVDIESLVYSYSFDEQLEQDWHWPEHFSPQPDLEAYANHVADRFGIREQIQFQTTVTCIRFDEEDGRWHVETDRADHVVARFVIAATGSLNATNVPEFPGLASFQGETYHTAEWPKEGVDLAGKRVGVIGTGSTGIQVIPIVAERAADVVVFQRTANFSIPTRNRPMNPDYEREYKAHYRDHREELKSMQALRGVGKPAVFEVDDEERERILEEAWESGGFDFLSCFNDIRTDLKSNDVVAEFVRNKIRATVKDPKVAELLCPTTHPLGTKRPSLDTGYYETFNRDNVTLVDVRANPITGFTPTGITTSTRQYDLDIVVFATGFDAMTGALTRMNVTGVGGEDLREHWVDGPSNYLGYLVAGYPNLFMIHGPGSPSVLAPMIIGAEQQIDWIANLLRYMHDHGYERVDTTPESEASWAREVDEAADKTLYKLADSWYVGANIAGKPRVFMVYVGGIDQYWRRSAEVAEHDYEGMVFDDE